MRETTHTFEYTLSILAKLERQALAEIQRLGGNERMTKIIGGLRVHDPSLYPEETETKATPE